MRKFLYTGCVVLICESNLNSEGWDYVKNYPRGLNPAKKNYFYFEVFFNGLIYFLRDDTSAHFHILGVWYWFASINWIYRAGISLKIILEIRILSEKFYFIFKYFLTV